MAELKIDPTENKTEHCKFYAEKSVKQAIQCLADRLNISFSEANRQLTIWGIQRGDW